MSLVAETGVGVAGAESYASITWIDQYWAARPHNALSATWDDADTDAKEGAAREASATIDSTYGPKFRGVRRGYVQGLQFPRTGAKDDAGYPLPDLPDELKAATAELAARALSAPLVEDVSSGGGILKRVKAGDVEVEYDNNGVITKTYPVVDQALFGLVNRASGWAFA